MSAPSSSHYNALYLKLQRRFSHGVSFLSSFSYGKSIDNGSGIRTSDGDSLTPSNNYDLGLETGLSAFDFRQRWTTSWLWDLPFGRGSPYPESRRRRRCVLGGWQLGGIFTMQERLPVHRAVRPRQHPERRRRLLSRRDRGRLAAARQRAHAARAISTPPRSSIASDPSGPFRYGTVPRNSLIGPGIISLDASANKRFSLGGSKYAGGPHRGIQPAQPSDLESARQSAANAHLRRHHQHPARLAADPDRSEVRVLSRLLSRPSRR